MGASLSSKSFVTSKLANTQHRRTAGDGLQTTTQVFRYLKLKTTMCSLWCLIRRKIVWRNTRCLRLTKCQINCKRRARQQNMRSMLFHIRTLRRVRPPLTSDAAKTVVCVPVRLDYNDVRLYGISGSNRKKLQCVQSALAQVVTGPRNLRPSHHC